LKYLHGFVIARQMFPMLQSWIYWVCRSWIDWWSPCLKATGSLVFILTYTFVSLSVLFHVSMFHALFVVVVDGTTSSSKETVQLQSVCERQEFCLSDWWKCWYFVDPIWCQRQPVFQVSELGTKFLNLLWRVSQVDRLSETQRWFLKGSFKSNFLWNLDIFSKQITAMKEQ